MLFYSERIVSTISTNLHSSYSCSLLMLLLESGTNVFSPACISSHCVLHSITQLKQNWYSKFKILCHPTRSEHKDQQRGGTQHRDTRWREFLVSAVLQELAGLSTATSAWSQALPTTWRRWLRQQSSTTTGWNLSWLTITRGWPLRREWVQCLCSSGWQELQFIYTWEFTRSAQLKTFLRKNQ